MDNFTLFVCGVVVTLVAGMGVITSEVFLGYYKYLEKERLRQLKKAQQQGLMDKSGKLTGLGQARSYARTKIQGISDPNLRGLATRAMNRGTKVANTAIQSYSAGGARGIAKGVLGSTARTAIRNPMMTAGIGLAVAGAMRGKNQSQTGAY